MPLIKALRKMYLRSGYNYKDADKLSTTMDFIVVFEYDLKDNYLSFAELIENRLNSNVRAAQKFKTLEAHYYQIPGKNLNIILILPHFKCVYGSLCFEYFLAETLSLIIKRIFSRVNIIEIVIDRNLYSSEIETEYWAEQIYSHIRKSNKPAIAYFGLRTNIVRCFLLFLSYYNFIAVLAGTMFIITRLFWSKMI